MISNIRWFAVAFLAGALSVAISAAQGKDGSTEAEDAATAHNSATIPDSDLTHPLHPTARWLLDQPDARMRAAGLLHLSGPMHGGGEFEADALLDEFEQAIENTTDGAALAWLASACRSAGITGYCIDAGLDDAIVRHDDANLWSRLTLVPDAEDGTRDRLIIEARSTRSYMSQLTSVWYEALDKAPDLIPPQTPNEKLVSAFAVGTAYAMPSYSQLDRSCTGELETGSELDVACTRHIDELASRGPTTSERSIGIALETERAEARGDRSMAARLEQRKIYESAVNQCRAIELSGILESFGESEARNFMQLLGEQGEIEAFARLAAEYDIDCSDPDDPMSDAMEAYAEQLEGDS